jgi:class 3 adenylate cyclase
MANPTTQYATSGDVHIAYQVVGDGAPDLVEVRGFLSHVDLDWDDARLARFHRDLASFSRLILFDKRGTGVSDRHVGMPTLEERMDDVRAVMDAAGSERAVLFGISEGAPMSVLFAATYPDRTAGLVLCGGMARSTWAPDYPWAAPAADLIEAGTELVAPDLFSGDDAEIWAPSLGDDKEAKAWIGKVRRASISPDGMATLYAMFLDIDVRPALATLRVPTLVLHRRGDRIVNRRAGQWMAEQIPGARYVELAGQDHFPWTGGADAVVQEIREFVTGARHAAEPDRVLATVMFTDIVGSTDRATSLGDREWRALLDAHDAAVRHQLERFRGREIKTTGDGFLATFDGPARAIRCGLAIHDAAAGLGIEVRVGLHTGEVELRGDDISGVAVNLAARVGALASPGEVLVSRTVTDLVAGSGITFSDRGERELKGITGRWRLFAVAAA